MIQRLLDTISPHRCSACGEIGAILCKRCKENIVQESYSGCVLCLHPCGPRGVCSPCHRKLPVEQAWCIGERSGALKHLGDEYKFNSRRAGAVPLAELLDRTVPLLPSDAVVMPVPTLPSTVRVRGFDHVGLVARHFARARGLEVKQLLERRARVTLHYLDRAARERLGPSLFAIRTGVEIPKHVVLVDDIVTTGTTLRAAVHLLKTAGVARVDVAVIARQPYE